MTTDVPQPTVRPADRGAVTRAALLAAAREVFVSAGYAQAGVTDIVARAGASVGSLYHHFTGKADLYVTLFEEFHETQARRARQAVREARAAQEACGDSAEPRQLFVAAARAYLDGCVQQRELSRLFVCGDAPPGFDLIMRQRLRDWADRNADFFARGTDPLDEALAVVMTGALMLAVAEVSLGDDAGHARAGGRRFQPGPGAFQPLLADRGQPLAALPQVEGLLQGQAARLQLAHHLGELIPGLLVAERAGSVRGPIGRRGGLAIWLLGRHGINVAGPWPPVNRA
jgi:AcrR family transcriptional regulator